MMMMNETTPNSKSVDQVVDTELETKVASGTAFQAVPMHSSLLKPSHDHAQTEFGLADLNIEDDLEMTDLDTDGLAAQDAAEAASEAANEGETETLNFALSGVEGAPLPDAPVEADGALIADLQSIPEKMAFKIGEAAEMVGVKQYVLRYWESEFEMLKPRKSRNGQRVYSRRDVECAMMIKKLLYNDRFSIEGARHALRQLKSNVKSIVKEEKTTQVLARTQESAVGHLRSLVEEIRRIRQSL